MDTDIMFNTKEAKLFALKVKLDLSSSNKLEALTLIKVLEKEIKTLKNKNESLIKELKKKNKINIENAQQNSAKPELII